MLFLPKYGTIRVCAAAAVAKPATSAATTSAAADDERVGSGTRVRMGKYLGKGDSWSETGCDLTVTAERLQTSCSTIPLSNGRLCPLPTAGPTPLGDKTIILGIDDTPPGFTSGVACVRGRGAGVARQLVPCGVAAHPHGGRRRGSGTGDLSEGVT